MVQIPQTTSSSANIGPVFKQEKDGTFKILKDKIFSMETLKAIGSLGGDTLKQAYADSQTDDGNFNNTFRTLAMGAAALIPYGGVAISPLIGLLWPVDNTRENNQLKKLMEKIAAQTHEQITNFDNEGLGGNVNDLKEKMREFEKLVNNNEVYYSNDHLTSKMNMQNKAVQLNGLFRTVIAKCQKPSYKNSELPIYITLVICHIHFMNFIKKHGKSLLHFDDKVLRDEFLDQEKQEKYTKEYINYLNSFAKPALKAADRAVHEGLPNLEAQRLSNPPTTTIGSSVHKKFTESINAIIKAASSNLEDVLNRTINNIEFKQAVNIKSEWTLDQNGRTFYYNLDGSIQTGWKEISTSFATRYETSLNRLMEHVSLKTLLPYAWYYFSTEKSDKFEKGEMYRDTKETINGKEYQFDIYGRCLNPNGGQITGWSHQGDAWYYFSSADGTKNWNGTTFKKGEMMTGWVRDNISKEYYYFTPEKAISYDKVKLAKGQMVTGWIEFPQGSKKWYFLDRDGSITGKKGQLVHNKDFTLDGKKYQSDGDGFVTNK
ncbi:N-acetylmuramoyl-L-alanine amidase family protein [Bacillus cereus]